MKRLVLLLGTLVLFIGMADFSVATPIEFHIDAAESSVSLSNVTTYFNGSISAGFAEGFGDLSFSLGDNGSNTFDFLNIDVDGGWWVLPGGGTAEITATLAFTLPTVVDVEGTGSGLWASLHGIISGGCLTWDNMPQSIDLGNGDYFTVDFEDIFEGGLGSSTTISATVTAHINDTAAPVPEPATVLLMGAGLIGMVVAGRKRLIKKS